MLRLKWGVFLVLVLSLFSCNKEDGFIIKGHFDNAEGKMVYLNRIQKSFELVDSVAVAEDGTFLLKGTFPTAELYLLKIGEEPVSMIYLVLDKNSQVSLSGDVNSLVDSYSVEDKSGDNVLMSEISKHNFKAQMKLQELVNEFGQIQSTVVNQDSLVKVFQSSSEVIVEEERVFIKQFIDEHPGSMVNVWAIYQQMGRELLVNPQVDMEYWQKVADGLNEKYPESLNTKEINNLIKQLNVQNKAQGQTDIGNLAPDFELIKADGSKMKLSDLRGQYVLLDFWASWCGPCRGENPNLVEAYNNLKGKKFTVYQVSLDKTKEAWLEAIEKDKLSQWHHASDLQYWQSAPAKLYGVRGIPANFLLSPEGKIIAKDLRGNNLAAEIAKYMN